MRDLTAKKGWLRFFLVLAAVMLLTSGIAYAAISVDKTVPGTVTVNLQSTPEGALGFYSDAACTVPVTTLNFGQLKPGVTGMVKVYIKNLTGGTTFQYFTATDDLLKGTATISPYQINPGYADYLTPGRIFPFEFFLNLDPDIPVGVYQFNITVNARDS